MSHTQNGVKPAFFNRNVAIVFSSSDYFSKFLAVCIKSVIDTASAENNYDIVIFERNISERNKKRIWELVKNKENFSIRFFNIKDVMKNYHFFLNSNRISQETYYGLLVPFLLPNYERAIVMDCDMIVKKDLSSLYFEDLEGKAIGGVNDIVLLGWLNDRKGKDAHTYYKEYLHVNDPYKFFNGGLLLIDFKKYRAIVTKEKVENYINNYKLRIVDQDIINILMEGRTKLLDVRWNHLIYVEGAVSEAIHDAPVEAQKLYFESQQAPYVIHYAGDVKPWNEPSVDFGDDFWEEARKTPFYEEILYGMINNISQKIVLSHEIIHHGSFIKRIVSPYRVNKLKVFVKTNLKKDSFTYKTIRRIYFFLTNRPYTK